MLPGGGISQGPRNIPMIPTSFLLLKDPNNWKLILYFLNFNFRGSGNVNFVSEKRQKLEMLKTNARKMKRKVFLYYWGLPSRPMDTNRLHSQPVHLHSWLYSLPRAHHSHTAPIIYLSSLLPAVSPTRCTPQEKGFAQGWIMDEAHRIYNIFPGSSPGLCHLFS